MVFSQKTYFMLPINVDFREKMLYDGIKIDLLICNDIGSTDKSCADARCPKMQWTYIICINIGTLTKANIFYYYCIIVLMRLGPMQKNRFLGNSPFLFMPIFVS